MVSQSDLLPMMTATSGALESGIRWKPNDAAAHEVSQALSGIMESHGRSRGDPRDPSGSARRRPPGRTGAHRPRPARQPADLRRPAEIGRAAPGLGPRARGNAVRHLRPGGALRRRTCARPSRVAPRALPPCGVTQPALLHPLPTTERWRIAARTALMALGVDEARPLLIAHPGAGARWKRAPAARFALALERMRGDGGFEVVVHQGPADAEAVGALALAQAYIGSDSGVSHLAASIGTPSVILFPPETLRRWAPWGPAAIPLGVGAEGEMP